MTFASCLASTTGIRTITIELSLPARVAAQNLFVFTGLCGDLGCEEADYPCELLLVPDDAASATLLGTFIYVVMKTQEDRC